MNSASAGCGHNLRNNAMDCSMYLHDPFAVPHNVSDLILALAIRLAANQCQVTTAYRHDEDGFPEPTDGDDQLVDLLRQYLLVAPDLPIAQQAAIHHHPDIDLVELCSNGDLVLVKAWFTAMNRNQVKVLDSTIMHCITAASASGHVDILAWMHRYSRRSLFYSGEAMDLASAAGEVHVLQWWLDSGLKLRYSTQAVDGASANAGCIDVLDWWKRSGLELKYDPNRVVYLCTSYGRVDCFEWWITKTGLIDRSMDFRPLNFALAIPDCPLDEYWLALKWRNQHGLPLTDLWFICLTTLAAKEGRLDVIAWVMEAAPIDCSWRKYALRCAAAAGQLDVIVHMIGDSSSADEEEEEELITACKELVDAASSNGHVHILEWWQQQRGLSMKLQYTAMAINDACDNGHLGILKWWAASGLECRYTPNCVNNAARNGHVHILEWLHEQPAAAPISFPSDYTSNGVDGASSRGHVSVLQFFLDSGREFRHSQAAINGASQFGLTHVLDWWLKNQDKVALKYSQEAIRNTATVPLLEWWKRSGLDMNLDRNFSGLMPMDSEVAKSIHWLIMNGFKITLPPNWLRTGIFELVECFVDVAGIKVTPKLVEQLRQQGQQEHVLEWLEARIDDGSEHT
ncbi:hypothetical protein BCR44DRAFT_92843 [Catenaria anguillulae PL171]|uniref:Ankyrin repeat-containing domain protein n=1 Tax=Catenaria anguillulae PL171 TaxID=765915 RepID=A0A1Y2HFB8_9FUNG|nr:hypothetical protein BCR44DRAFT_92843 [Catenaria anguillulae PL171]